MKIFREVGKNAVLKAGKHLLDKKDVVQKIKDKFNGADIFTTADKESEEIITEIIHKNFPNHAIFSEESGDIYGGNEFQWVMDPLDGTKHYIKGLPFFAVSLVLRNPLEPLIALTYIPITNELFIAEKGKGTTYNEKVCRVSDENNLANAIIYVEFPSTKFKVEWKRQDYDIAWRMYETLTRTCFRTRAYGSGPIGMAYTSMGGFDAYVRFQPLSYEDVLAGSLMIKEAGGVITDRNGNLIEMKSNELNTRVVASNGKIHDQILNILKE